MKINIRIAATGLLTAAIVFASLPANATDRVFHVKIRDALASSDAHDSLDGSVKFYFGDAKHPKIARSFGNYVTNKKTNGFGKSAETACRWVFLSALLQLQERAKQEGADAVVNIQSYYKKHAVSSRTDIECHKGFLIAGIALRGDVVRLAGH